MTDGSGHNCERKAIIQNRIQFRYSIPHGYLITAHHYLSVHVGKRCKFSEALIGIPRSAKIPR
jgi:hypothetical protein